MAYPIAATELSHYLKLPYLTIDKLVLKGRGISGGAILGNGRVGLILDP